MPDPINLNRARKAKARSADKAQAAENRVKFGRSKAEKAIDHASAERLSKLLDQTRRDDPG